MLVSVFRMVSYGMVMECVLAVLPPLRLCLRIGYWIGVCIGMGMERTGFFSVLGGVGMVLEFVWCDGDWTWMGLGIGYV